MNTEILMRFVVLFTVGLVIKWLMMRANNKNLSGFKGYFRLIGNSIRILCKHKWIFLVSFFVALPSKIYDNLLTTFVDSNFKHGVNDYIEVIFNLKWKIVQNINNWYSTFNEIATTNPLPSLRYNFISIALMVILYFFYVKSRLDKIGSRSPVYGTVYKVFYPTFTIAVFSIVYYLSPFYYRYLLSEAVFNLKYWLVYLLPSSYLILISGIVFSVILLVSAKAFYFNKNTSANDYFIVFVNNFGRLFLFFFMIFLLSIFYSFFQGEILYPAKIDIKGTYLFNFLYSAFIWMFIFTPFIIIDDGKTVFASLEKSLKFWFSNIPELLTFFTICFLTVFIVNLLPDVISIEGIGIEFSIYENLLSFFVVFLKVLVKGIFAVGIGLLFIELKYQKTKR